ncbi:MAG: serine protease [Candidatus Phosphoribacter baldrii]
MKKSTLSVPVLAATCLTLVACTGSSVSPPAAVTVIQTASAASPSSPHVETIPEMFARVRSGVVRIQAVGCQGTSVGSGYFVGDRLIATVAHVVEDAQAIAVRGDNGVGRGTVVGIDAKRELALLRLEPSSNGAVLTGFHFAQATEAPKIGQDVFVLGYPMGEPLTFKRGSVTSVNRELELDDKTIRGIFQHDALVTGGNSGGPLVDATGTVVGLHEAGKVIRLPLDGGEVVIPTAGTQYAIPVSTAAPLLTGWAAGPVPVPSVTCPWSTAPLLTVTSTHPEAPIIALVLHAHYSFINQGSYNLAWDRLSPSAQEKTGGFGAFVEGHSASVISDAVLYYIARESLLSDTVRVRFTSNQDASAGPSGQTCTKWHLEYSMNIESGYWRIGSAKNLDPPKACA